jgi:hypothetical protein
LFIIKAIVIMGMSIQAVKIINKMQKSIDKKWI